MPSIGENLRTWSTYDWRQGGDEWSSSWGGPRMQWWGTVFPRIQAFVPGRTIVEIAPGHGRFTQFLLGECRELIGVDITAACVDACQRRFATAHARFFVGDGRSLFAVADASVDFAFSFDSLVHVDPESIRGYCGELRRVLAPTGAAFLHHSNLGAYAATVDLGQPTQNPHWRDTAMSADHMVEFCREAGLSCVAQELLTWGSGSELLSDCFSVLTRPGSPFDRPLRRWTNSWFIQEVRHLRALAHLFAADGSAPATSTPAQ